MRLSSILLLPASSSLLPLLSSSCSFGDITMVHAAQSTTTSSSSGTMADMMAKNQFLQAMRETNLEQKYQQQQNIKQQKQERYLRLQKAILSAAIPSHKLSTSTSSSSMTTTTDGHDGIRSLANNNYYDNNNNNYYDNNNNNNYYNNNNNNAQAAAQEDEYSNYGFNITKYSLKYAGCSSIATYSDDLAMDEGATTVFAVDQYVVFRFCPSKTCSASSTYGCMSDYGEYMVPIESWLEIISNYRDEEFDRYCNYCQTCYGGGNNNGNRMMEDAAQGDDAAAAAAAGDDFVNNCSYQSQCSGYADVCYNQNHVDLSKFFECKEYAANDDLTLYLGPHCASDKKTILLGVYEDEYCSKYVGDKYDVATLTGLTLSADEFEEYYQSDCIPCQESSLKFQNVDNDNVDVDTVNELCENLYDYAAKCNRHVSGATSASYQSYQQEDNELAVCSYIASVVTGTYDEYGFIYVDPLSFESDNKYNQYTKIAMRKGVVMSSQIIGILFFMVVMIGMTIYAGLLHLRIQKRAEALESLKEPMAVERKDSGIMLARSGTTDTYRAPGGAW